MTSYIVDERRNTKQRLHVLLSKTGIDIGLNQVVNEETAERITDFNRYIGAKVVKLTEVKL